MTTKYRGAQVAPNTEWEDVFVLLTKKANLVRYQFNPNYYAESLSILEDQVLEAVADVNDKAQVIIDVHQPINGTNPTRRGDDQNAFIDLWRKIVRDTKGFSNIFGYGILNEPSGSGQAVNHLMSEAHRAIRAIDKERRIIVTCPFSDPGQFYKIKKIADDKVWYEVHMYQPMALTHQGIAGRLYPKNYPTKLHNKDYLRNALRHVRKFQTENRARIYVGEYGISTYAPYNSRVNYFLDCISLFEEYGWNHTVHAWREAPVWTIEGMELFYKNWEKNK